MSSTYSAQLAEVRAAIAARVSGAEEVTLPDGRRVKYAPLAELQKRETWLIGMAARESRGGGVTITRGAGA